MNLTNGSTHTRLIKSVDPRLRLSISFLLFFSLVVYFRYFPTIISDIVSDSIVLFSLLCLFVMIIVGSVLDQGVFRYLSILLAVLLVFFARSIRYIRTPFPMLWDPYTHMAAATNILRTNQILPATPEWTTVLYKTSFWPMLYTLSAEITRITSIDTQIVHNYLLPFTGVVFFLVIYIFSRRIAGLGYYSLVGALVSSFASNVIFYQSEFHPQGFSLLFLAMFLYFYSLNSDQPQPRLKLLEAVTLVGFLFSHYFSPLFLSMVGAGAVCLLILRTSLGQYFGMRSINSSNLVRYEPLLLLGVVILFYHLWSPAPHLEYYLQLALTASPDSTSLTTTDKLFISDMVRRVKWVILAISLPGLAYSIWKGEKSQLIVAAFIFSLLGIGVLGRFGIFLEVGRTVTFYSSIVGVMCALSLKYIHTLEIDINLPVSLSALISLGISILLVISFIGGHFVPAYYFHSVDEHEGYYNNNQVASMEQYQPAGYWFKEYSTSEYQAISDTRSFTGTIPFYWGETPVRPGIFPWYDGEPSRQVTRWGGINYHIDRSSAENRYFFVNVNDQTTVSKADRKNGIYANGEISIYFDFPRSE
ncbi:hypothetical protein JK354_19685 [Haloferax volcanii]|uniref:Glycosyltransferase RgtA/B/C/D-like domain-containing protein n=4 Tax=Haloferax volcanii TaxID=2246 RepID=D4GU65_HALVD|nr:uncharacterized protein HVO_2052 [Haloferax volcanii DS2]MBS8121352.1 hypothetical protein [Haloferax volcanii]ELY34303.1 hypothetical protein C498_05548 [Haloferax volcanii DS2]MBS8126360.1 hypothetical protein [Haloferax volcanii]MBS8130228.1 hypothetical protein [Haloferax volcanii]